MAGFFKRLLQRFSRRKVDLDELEESLISADVGLRMTTQILDRLRAMGRSLDPEEVRGGMPRGDSQNPPGGDCTAAVFS